MENVYRIDRGRGPGQYLLEDLFADIRAYPILNVIFGDAEQVGRVVAQTRVYVIEHPHEMFVDNADGSITIGLAHLQQASDEYLYLDIIHELCHVKQHMEGLDLYDRSKSYVDRETEIEAYRITVQEARRIGLTDEAIACYLHVSWITPVEHERLAGYLGVEMKSAGPDPEA